jgi:AmiR/NasT family two-component response regulator
MRPETLSIDFPWVGTSTSPPVIPVVTYENPSTIEAVLRLNAFAAIPSPVRSFGLLTALRLAACASATLSGSSRSKRSFA